MSFEASEITRLLNEILESEARISELTLSIATGKKAIVNMLPSNMAVAVTTAENLLYVLEADDGSRLNIRQVIRVEDAVDIPF